MSAVGIDLGTTHSLVACLEGGQPRCLLNAEGDPLLPSVVSFYGEDILVGHEALAAAIEHPQETVVSVKRFMGRSAQELAEEELLSVALEQKGSALMIRAGERDYSPVEISAEILKVLAARADAALGGGVDRAVITVPAYFDDAQRNATRQAGRMAGLEVMRLLNEPTAAALAYGLQHKREGKFAIFDLGGGTFDISILHLVEGVFEVLSTGGDTRLGGDDFDRFIAGDLLQQGGLEAESLSPQDRRTLLRQARNLKQQLSQRRDLKLEISLSSGSFKAQLSRDRLTLLLAPLLKRLELPCRRALTDAELRPEQLDGVVLVGGSTRSPIVREFVQHFFAQRPLDNIDPDQVVALGAAIQADLLSLESELRILDGGDILLLDVIPLSLGLETMGGLVEKIIHRNSAIPNSVAQEFTTFQDGQTGMDIHVLQGERELVTDCRSLARFRLTGIPPRAAGLSRVRVSFQVDADGILQVKAQELSTGVEQSVRVEPGHGLSDEQVEEMLQSSLDKAEEDVMARFLRTAQVEAERVIIPIRKAMSQDADLLDSEEHEVIEEALQDLESALKGEDFRLIQDLSALLDQVSGGFAQRRMERALQQGLEQVKIEDLEKDISP